MKSQKKTPRGIRTVANPNNVCFVCSRRLFQGNATWGHCSRVCPKSKKVVELNFADFKKGEALGCKVCHVLSISILAFLNATQECVSSETLADQQIELYSFHLGACTVGLTAPRYGEFTNVRMALDVFAESPGLPVPGNSIRIPRRMSLEYAASSAKDWISRCQRVHPACHISQNTVLPTRVLDLGDSSTSSKIKILASTGFVAPYIALSYCWGDTQTLVKSTSVSLPLWTDDLPWDILPLLFKDVIQLTRALGVRYLWIDCLCVLQDDLSDWQHESANMASIYSNSYLTIAASRAPNPHTPLFHPRWTREAIPPNVRSESIPRLPVDSVKVGYLFSGEELYVRPQLHLAHDRFIQFDNAENHAEDSPLLTRAWAFQERILPTRALHFHAEELVWECASGVTCECRQLYDHRFDGRPAPEKDTTWLKQTIMKSLQPNQPAKALGYVWLDVVSEFSQLRLTNEDDRMVAVSGIASIFSGKSLGNFVAGIWEGDFARGLLYTRNHAAGSDPTHEKAGLIRDSQPSWSWSSVPLDGTNYVTFNAVLRTGLVQDSNFKVLRLSCLPASENRFSWVLNAELQVCASFLMATVLFSTGLVINVGDSHYCQNGFLDDRSVALKPDQKLYCLLVGCEARRYPREEAHHYALVLVENGDSRFKRVGLLHAACRDWFSQAPVRSFNLN